MYDTLFATADVPYGRHLPENFLADRVFSSSLWTSDCSSILVAPGGEGVGWVVANRRLNPSVGEGEWLWLHLMGVAPAWQRRGLGRRLLQTLLETANREGKRGVATAMQWAGIWPGIPQGLTAMGSFCRQTGAVMRPGEIYLEKNLLQPWPQEGVEDTCALREGIALGPYTERHRAGLSALLQGCFSPGWQHETLSRIDPAYEPFNGYGLAAAYAADHPGRGVWIVEDRDRVVGFAVVQGMAAGGTAFFGPIGLLPEWRGQGLGGALLRAVARQARWSGCHTLGLWTSLPLAEGFYLPMGWQRVTATWHGEWRLPGGG